MKYDLFKRRSLPKELFEQKHILDIGCGRRKLEGSIGLDHVSLPGVDVVADLNHELPFEADTFDVVHADQVLEHVENLTGLVYEVYRILKPGGKLIAHVPYFRSSWAHIDPTHVRSFTIQGMNFYVSGTHQYENYRFRDDCFGELEVYLDSRMTQSRAKVFLSNCALRNPGWFENSMYSNLFPFSEISYVMTK